MKRIATVLLLSTLILLLGVGSSMAAIWSSTALSVLYGTKNQGITFNPDTATLEGFDQDKTIFTLEHASAWKYGDNFFFFDIGQPFDVDTSIYGEWHPRLSFGKMTGNNFGFAFVKDVLIATELNVNDGGRVYLYGAGFDLDIPHFQFFSLNIYIRNDPSIEEETTYQISPAWNIPFTLGSAKFEFRGFLDYAGSAGTSEANFLAQPQLLLDLGSFSDKPGNLYAGIEYQYWTNKYGIKDIDENYVQFMGKWIF
jgi:nucleoside-specific outer membrane channel protein Tsx